MEESPELTFPSLLHSSYSIQSGTGRIVWYGMVYVVVRKIDNMKTHTSTSHSAVELEAYVCIVLYCIVTCSLVQGGFFLGMEQGCESGGSRSGLHVRGKCHSRMTSPHS